MPTASAPDSIPLGDNEIARLERGLEAASAGLEPLDISALDGYLCGVLLQPAAVPAPQWLRWVADVDGRPWPDGAAWAAVAALVQRRHAELGRAIEARQWFDPWVFEVDDPSVGPIELVQPWAAGLSLALERFPGLTALDAPAAVEPMAVLFSVFDPEDLEDADELRAVIETLEPPADLTEAVEDLVRSVLLLADVSRPLSQPASRLRSRPPGRRHRP